MLENSAELPEYLLNLLFLPLLGGYWFYQKLHWTSFRANRLTGQRLIFHAAACGLLLLAVTRVLMLVAENFHDPDGPWYAGTLWGVLPACALALVIGTAGLARSAWKQGFVAVISGEKLQTNAPADAPADYGVIVPSRFDAICKVVLGSALILTLVIAGTVVKLMDPALNAIRWLPFTWTLALLLGVSGWNHAFVNRYVAMPAASFLFRYSAGLLVVCLALLDSGQHIGRVSALWREIVPLDSAGLPFLACLLGLVSWWPLNLFMPYEVAVARLHEDGDTDSLEQLFFRASLDQKLLMVTMDDGKVYVGHIRWLPPNPRLSDAYFQFLPAMSGYRDPVTRRVTFTDFYVSAYDAFLEDADSDDDEQLRPFVKILPVRAVASANGFEPSVFELFAGEDSPPERDSPGADVDSPEGGTESDPAGGLAIQSAIAPP